jgi:hypothetical protein
VTRVIEVVAGVRGTTADEVRARTAAAFEALFAPELPPPAAPPREGRAAS